MDSVSLGKMVGVYVSRRLRAELKQKLNRSVSIDWLKQHACWIIMDPWKKQPRGSTYPGIDKQNYQVLKKIIDYLPEVPHWIVSCPVTVINGLAHLPNYKNDENALKQYINVHDLQAIVYTGLHHGLCIVGKPLGVAAMSKQWPCYVYRPMVGMLIGAEWTEHTADRETEKYAELITKEWTATSNAIQPGNFKVGDQLTIHGTTGAIINSSTTSIESNYEN